MVRRLSLESEAWIVQRIITLIQDEHLNHQEAADRLGITYNQFRRLLLKTGISKRRIGRPKK